MAKAPSVTDQALKKLADQLTCSVCLDTYTAPKLLQCFHVYCEECLQKLACRGQPGSLTCPNCRRATQIPPNGIPALQPAFHIHHLFEIRDSLKKMKTPQEIQCEKCKQQNTIAYCRDCGEFICEMCKLIHATWKELSSHEVISLDQLTQDVNKLVSPKKTVSYCPKHPSKQADLYCQSCDELICRDCIVRAHRDHQYDLITDAYPKHKAVIMSHQQVIAQQAVTVSKAVKTLDARYQYVSDQRAAMEAKIQEKIQQLQESLEVRKTELVSELNRLTQQKLKSLAAQRDQFELIQTRLSSCLQFVEESLRTGTKEEILGMKKPLVKQVEEFTAELQPEVVVPKQKAVLTFSYNTELRVACQQFGDLRICKLASSEDDSTMKASVKTMENSEHEYEDILYQPNRIVPNKKLGRTIDGLRQPWGVAVNEREEIIVSQFGQHCVFVFSPEGETILTFGSKGSGPGQFNYPTGVAIDRHGSTCMLITDYRNHRIQKFSPERKFIKSVGTKGHRSLQFNQPIGIAINQQGKVYVCDSKNHRVQVLNPDLKFHSSFGGAGSNDGQFNEPWGVAFDSRGNVYITDYCNHRVQVFTRDGHFLRKFGKEGSGDRELCGPASVVIDSNDRVFVAEYRGNRVSVFTSQGEFVRTIGSQGTELGQFNGPCGIAVDSQGTLYISEQFNNRIQIIEVLQQ